MSQWKLMHVCVCFYGFRKLWWKGCVIISEHIMPPSTRKHHFHFERLTKIRSNKHSVVSLKMLYDRLFENVVCRKYTISIEVNQIKRNSKYIVHNFHIQYIFPWFEHLFFQFFFYEHRFIHTFFSLLLFKLFKIVYSENTTMIPNTVNGCKMYKTTSSSSINEE